MEREGSMVGESGRKKGKGDMRRMNISLLLKVEETGL